MYYKLICYPGSSSLHTTFYRHVAPTTEASVAREMELRGWSSGGKCYYRLSNLVEAGLLTQQEADFIEEKCDRYSNDEAMSVEVIRVDEDELGRYLLWGVVYLGN